ncbi:hypothetical protein [Bradyrhizobium mercantei]|uniref:hypothetical protein n=1 Tax=Bradyrhizobium mercantei TaxID=1904807 RepID=UPI000978217C|nr:hypothetical protein [Bradyrhizobium mercantei]
MAGTTHCRYGHELTLENTQLRFSTKGNYPYRRCRICFDLTDSDIAGIEKHFFNGGSIRSLDLTAPKMLTFKECETSNPVWWNRITALSNHNGRMNKANAARALKAQQTHCKQGHPFSGDNLLMERDSKTGAPRRTCRACRRASYEKANYKYTAEQVETATDCIMNKGMTISEVTTRRGDRSRIIKFEALAFALSKDPGLNERVRHQSAVNTDAKHRSRLGTWKSKTAGYMSGSEIAAVITAHPEWTARRVAEETGRELSYVHSLAWTKGLKTAPMRANRPKLITPRGIVDRGPTLTGIIAAQPHEVYTTIDQIVPRNIDFERRKEIVSAMCLAALEGEFDLADAKAAYPRFLSASYRQFSYKAFGDIRCPVSLDAPVYLDSTMLRVETVSETLWEHI